LGGGGGGSGREVDVTWSLGLDYIFRNIVLRGME